MVADHGKVYVVLAVVQHCNPSRGMLSFRKMEHRFNPDHLKSSPHYAGYMCINSITELLTPGNWKCWKNKAIRVAQWSARSWVRFPIFHIFNPMIMIVTESILGLVCVLNHCEVAVIMIVGVLGIFTSEI